MNQELIISILLLDNRPNSVLNEFYEVPLLENTELVKKIEYANSGNYPALISLYGNIPMNEIPTSTTLTETDKLIIGMTLLNGFVKMNFTGPFDLPIDENSKKDIEYLTIDAEKVNKHTVNSFWLHISAKIFGILKDSQIPLINVFVARQALIHQRMLENQSDSLSTRIGYNYQQAVKELDEVYKPILHKTLYDRFHGKFNCELAVGLLLSQSYRWFSQQLNKITQEHKIFVELSGQMGKRTKFQEKETAQLFVKVDRIPNPLSEIKRQQCEKHLKETELEDISDMLSQVSYSGDIGYTPLSTYDEAFVLLNCMNRYRKNARSELILEEVIPYCNRVLRDRIDFSTFIMTVLLKSRYESTVTHYLWRSIAQADEVVKYLEMKEEMISSAERLESIYMVALPNIYQLRKEVGMRMLLMGEAANAINYFTSVDMKNEIVAAYLSLRQKDKAEELAREMLQQGKRDSELLVLMYEITNNPQYLIDCWEESNHTYVHSQRILGQYYFNQKNWKKAIEHFEIALNINPIYQRLWFALGCAYIQLNNNNEAKKAFTRGVNLDNEDGQCWANLAYIHSAQGNKREAQVALKEAIKYIRNNEELWKNLIIISVDIRDYRQAISGLVSLYDINRSAVNPKILSMMCDVILQDIPMLNGETGRNMKGFMMPLLRRIKNDFKTTDMVYQVAKEGIELLSQLE